MEWLLTIFIFMQAASLPTPAKPEIIRIEPFQSKEGCVIAAKLMDLAIDESLKHFVALQPVTTVYYTCEKIRNV